MTVKSLSHVLLLATLWTAAYQAPPSMGFSRQEYWSGVPLLSLKLFLGPCNILEKNKFIKFKFSSVSSLTQSYLTLCDPMNHSTPGLPVHHQLPESPKPMSIELVMPSNHLILWCPLLLLPSIFPSISVFSNESLVCRSKNILGIFL